MTTSKTYETERLLLQPTTVKDAAFILELVNSPKWKQYIGERNLRTIADAENYIRDKKLTPFNVHGFGNYTVIRKADRTKIGTTGLYDRAGIDGIDLGFAFLPAYEKQGYAFEAANKLVQLAFTDFELTHLSGITIKENIDSQRLLEKLGFSLHGIINIPNDPEELLHYKLVFLPA